VFVLPVGRTNTEYYSLDPVYGSNLNSSYVKKVRGVLFLFAV
jgi:hypothetical protein